MNASNALKSTWVCLETNLCPNFHTQKKVHLEKIPVCFTLTVYGSNSAIGPPALGNVGPPACMADKVPRLSFPPPPSLLALYKRHNLHHNLSASPIHAYNCSHFQRPNIPGGQLSCKQFRFSPQKERSKLSALTGSSHHANSQISAMHKNQTGQI